MGGSDPERTRGVSLDRRTFVKRSAAGSVGVGLGLGFGSQDESTPEEPGIQTYDFVVPEDSVPGTSYVNKFLFVTASRRERESVPFAGCFERTEERDVDNFDEGAYVWDGVVVDATDSLQLFGGDDALERIRRMLEGDVEFPDALTGGIGSVTETRLFTPVSAGALPLDEGYRVVGGENCDAGYVRLEAHELAEEVTGN
ncbi:twin-arginine translocation signal domain-containing protein [Halorussus marinus]|uniref:twin-arginine translocation signal domain-containing protein n=1 Tax=Halorussus marinus TaxID=2505976 RepID=UPI001091E0BD|nr:twin-arginine translocation signal domain-containing protein [Halorussus marinus]